jgi:hypothetical protein
VPKRKEATEDAFEFDGEQTVVHLSTNARFTAYPGQGHFSNYLRGELGSVLRNGDDYEEDTVFRIANKLLPSGCGFQNGNARCATRS